MNEAPTLPHTPAAGQGTDSTTTAQVVYGLHLASLITGGLTSLVAVIVAYVFRGDAQEWLKPHYTLQIRTFWIALLFGLVGFVLSFILVGFLVWGCLAVWLIVRCVKGFQYLAKREPYPNPETWLW
jgi:uncharacterized membrane protein